MEDHHGELVLKNRDEGGALISLVFHPDLQMHGAGADPGTKNDTAPPDSMEVATRIMIDGS